VTGEGKLSGAVMKRTLCPDTPDGLSARHTPEGADGQSVPLGVSAVRGGVLEGRTKDLEGRTLSALSGGVSALPGVQVKAGRARRSPPGHWPIDARYPHVTVAGCSLHCAGCGTEGRAPLPRAPGYAAAVQAFLEAHKSLPEGREVLLALFRAEEQPPRKALGADDLLCGARRLHEILGGEPGLAEPHGSRPRPGRTEAPGGNDAAPLIEDDPSPEPTVPRAADRVGREILESRGPACRTGAPHAPKDSAARRREAR
jgi:hypothetical protein